MVAGVERSHRKELSGQREAEVEPVHDLFPILSLLCGHEEMIKKDHHMDACSCVEGKCEL